jgi:MFS family permease
MKEGKYPPASLAWLVWGLGAAFYFAGFFQRVAPAVITEQLMAEFSIGARELGQFSAFYFYSYVLVQIPTGILADHWGSRKLLTAGSLVAACGIALFASASSIAVADLGRLLIGGAAGVVFVALLKLSTQWFPLRIFATVSGFLMFVGVAGAVFGGIPMHYLVQGFGWRPVMLVAAAIQLLIAAGIWQIVRDDPGQRNYRSYAPPEPATPFSVGEIAAGLAEVLRYRNTWLASLLAGCMSGPVIAFAGLWGVPYLTTHYGLPTAASSALTSLLLVFYAVGGIVAGIWSDRIGRRKPVLVAGTVAALFCWIPVLLVPSLPLWLLGSLMVLAGLFAGSIIVTFAFVKESIPPALAGTGAGVCNMGSMLGGLFLQQAVGWLLDFNWGGALKGGVRIYDLAAYRSGFYLMLLFSILAVAAIAFTTEPRRRAKAGASD